MNVRYHKIYVMTLPRSGSTILGHILAGHPDICHIGESMYWELLNPADITCSCGQKDCRFLNAIYKKLKRRHVARPLLRLWQIIDKKYWPNKPPSGGSLISGNEKIPKESAVIYWLARCARSLDVIIEAYRQSSRRKVFVDNSKLHHIGLRLAVKNGWGVIVLLRDPRGIMSSYKNAGKRKGDLRTAASVLPFCLDFIKAAYKVRNKPNVLVIKYEDLCENPQSTIRSISRFIGVKYNQRMLDFRKLAMQKRGHVLKGNRLLRQRVLFELKADTSWSNNLTSGELHELKNRAKLTSYYKPFGYRL